MRIVLFLNGLGLGGTEKAAARWARGLRERNHDLWVLTLEDGPRRREFEEAGIEIRVVPSLSSPIAEEFRSLRPDVIHAHAPGHPHRGDVLGEALAALPKIPVLQTNVFGQALNPKENRWTDFRLYVSWTSCVQAARRNFRRLDANFFRDASVALYPLDPIEQPAESETRDFREKHGVASDEILFGRLSRPEPNKWTNLALAAFRLAASHDPKTKLLLREPPSEIRRQLERASDRDRFVVLPATKDAQELTITIASIDVVLHTSIIGESFGYGIAEPMNLAKPVIANSTPWGDQAQIELVRHGEGGYIASTPASMAEKAHALAADPSLRAEMGRRAQSHIRQLTNPEGSVDRLEAILRAVVERQTNPFARDDLRRAEAAARYLDQHQFGESWREQLSLRPFHYRVRFHQLRSAAKTRIFAIPAHGK